MRAKEMRVTGRLSTTSALVHTSLVILLLCSSGVQAQEKESPDRGFTPGGSYAISDIETINTTNGNLMFNIPVGVLPPGRGGMSARLNLIYNSKIWEPNTQYRECPKNLDPGQVPPFPECSGDARAHYITLGAAEDSGWRYAYKYELKLVERNYSPPASYDPTTYNPCTDDLNIYRYKLFVVFPDGGRHEFRLYGEQDLTSDGYFKYMPDGRPTNQCPNNTRLTGKMVYYSTDGTYMRLEVEHDEDQNWANNPYTIYMANGTRVKGQADDKATQQIIDRNGNSLEIQEVYTNNIHTASKLVDQLGREVVIEYGTNGQDVIRQRGVNNVEITTTVKWKAITVNKTYNSHIGVIRVFGNNKRVVDQLILPSQLGGLAYTFGYNAGTIDPSVGWGEVSSVVLPSGASVSYQYKMDNQTGQTVNPMDVVDNSPTRKELRYKPEHDGDTSTEVTEVWTYSIPKSEEGGTSTITGPDGSVSKESFYGTGDGTSPFGGLVYKSERADGTITERLWMNNKPYNTNDQQVRNTYVKTEFISTTNASGQQVKTVVKDFDYDKNGNLLRLKESDWISYGSLHNDGSPVWANVQNVSFKRTTLNSYYAQAPNASENEDHQNVYVHDTSPWIRGSVSSTELRSGSVNGTVFSRSEFVYDNPLVTGNLKEQRAWDSEKGPVTETLTAANAVIIKNDYDQYGNVLLTTNALGSKTKYTYGIIDNGATGGVSSLYPTQTETAFGTAEKRTTKQEYDFWTGLVTKATDADNNVSTRTTYDIFGRPVLVQVAEGIQYFETRTAILYSDTQRRVVTRTDLDATGDGKIVKIQHYDPLGRLRLTRQLESAVPSDETDETKGVKVQTRYFIDQEHHHTYQLVSTPYRANYSAQANEEGVDGETMGWTRTKADRTGRVVEMQTFSGSSLPAPWGTSTTSTGKVITSYDAEYTTVRDQANRARRSVVDGFGNLVRIDEPEDINDPTNLGPVNSPAQSTGYAYDITGNLTQVVQGAQTRTFSYSSLSRLIAATNPESGTVQYRYDASGNLVLKIDPRPRPGNTSLQSCSIPYTGDRIATCYEYDSLNRTKSRTYNDGTPGVTFTYDTLTNGKGRLTSVSSTVSTTSYAGYDVLGRVLGSTQVTDGRVYTMPEYRYDLANNLVSQKYPSGKVVVTELDSAGRLAGVRNNATGGYYAGSAPADTENRIRYSAHNAITAIKLGNQLWEHTSFNSRLQPVEIGLGASVTDSSTLKLAYKYGVRVDGVVDETRNNGNLESQTITGAGLSLTQSYTYDQLNRLKTFTETGGLYQTYEYDRYGNRALTAGYVQQAITPAVQSLSTFNHNNNRILSAAYDAAGNLTGGAAGHNFGYDAENHMTAHDDPQTLETGDNRYFYDGEGKRVKKINGGVTTVYVYNAASQLVAEYSDQTSSQTGGTSYFTQDHLGSPRVITNSQGEVVSRHDYMPFGEEIRAETGGRTSGQGYVEDNVRQKFTGYERDDETGLDYAQARYYSSTQGRFTSVDPFYIDLRRLPDPQQLNIYSYARNNPLKFIDPFGLDITVTGSEQSDYLKRLQRNTPSFNITYDSNKVVIVDANGQQLDKKALKALGQTLKGDEKQLFNAITDTEHHVTIDTVRQDSTVFFGSFDGKGKNTLDFGDIDLLDSPKNAGGITAEQVVGHETLEAYASSKGSEYSDAHDFANQYFGGLKEIKNTGKAYSDPNNPNAVSFVSAEFSVIGKKGVRAEVLMRLRTPIPVNSIQQMFKSGSKVQADVVAVEKRP